MAKEIKPEVYFRDQPPLEQKPSWRQVLAETKNLQKEMSLSQGKDSLNRSELAPVFTNDRTKLFLYLSDMHFFSPQTDYDRIEDAFETLERPDTFGIFMGDDIEGQKPDALEQSTGVLYSSGDQVKKFKKVLYDLVGRGKILGLAGGYSGHAEWIKRFSGVDGVQVLADRVKFPDGSELRVLMPWGRFAPEFPNGKSFGLLIFHNPGGGGSDDINPNGAVRKRVIEYRQDPRNKDKPIIGAVGGDKHHRGAVSVERTIDPNSGKEITKVLGSMGSFKGLDNNNQDPFLAAMGKGASVPPGFGMVVLPRLIENGNANYVWATYGDGFGKPRILHEAAALWDASERQNHTKGLIEQLISKHKPKLEADTRRSSIEATTDESVDDVKLFRRFGKVVNGNPDMPYRIDFLANARYGSESGKKGRAFLKEILADAQKDPYTFVLIMRHFIDSDVAGSKRRKHILYQMINDLVPVYNNGGLIAIMMSESFRNKKWQSDLTNKGGGKPLRPGDEIFNNSPIKGTLLYTNRTKFIFQVGQRDYLIQLMDHLGGTGTKFAPERGLHRSQDEGSVDIVAGGHMPGAGYETTPFASFINPGWAAEYESEGVSNKEKSPVPGVSADFYKGEIYVAPSREVSNDMHAAFMLHGGIDENTRKKILSKVK